MIDLADLIDALGARLGPHIAQQRWAGAHDRPIDHVELLWYELIRTEEPLLLWTVARATFADGGTQDYQLFLGVRPVEPAPEFLHGKERELVAYLPDAPIGAVVYDALVDPDLAIEVLHFVAPGTEVTVRRPIVLEHSNSSVVYDETHILKVFRKVEAGPNPDVEITRVLAERGYEHVLEPTASLERDGVDLAVLRSFLVGCTEGWELARASVRDLLAGGLAPEESGADFAPDAERLGTILAGLHIAMGEAWGRAPGDAARWAAEMTGSLEEVLTQVVDVPSTIDVDEIRRRFDGVGQLADPGQEIRIHGDLHLAQVLKTDVGWKILDFEGEPARRRDERFTTSSPLRDVAGMLRSLHYVAATGLAEWLGDGVDDAGPLHALVDQWEERNRTALLGAYLAAEGIDSLLPADPASLDALLAAFELDKAVYEVGYELGHRPDHVSIPVSGIRRVLQSRAGA